MVERAGRIVGRSSGALVVLAVLVGSPSHAQALKGGGKGVVYANDFQAKPGSAFPGWSSSRVRYRARGTAGEARTLGPEAVTNVESPNRARRFLGEFGGPRVDPSARTRVEQAVRLDLKGLPPHKSVTVAFDLLILKSWDGNSPQYGPDRWALKVRGGPTLLDTTFSNNPKLESDKSDQDYPRPGSRPQAGAASVKAMDYGFFGDSTYRLEFSFPHEADALALDFSSDLFEGKGTADESWGLDNISVRVDAPRRAPPPGVSPRPTPISLEIAPRNPYNRDESVEKTSGQVLDLD